eukprot:TRINITY_DN8841_c0_g1_i1.p1 TRINITY_DN8841_c0_g1~~TRINITY_DN8841_c0_g1_i1.p1  ORF type:complete len:588 (+),score=266.36 TRINITY_DN8841_c0_g1_i1:205-1764(+)
MVAYTLERSQRKRAAMCAASASALADHMNKLQALASQVVATLRSIDPASGRVAHRTVIELLACMLTMIQMSGFAQSLAALLYGMQTYFPRNRSGHESLLDMFERVRAQESSPSLWDDATYEEEESNECGVTLNKLIVQLTPKGVGGKKKAKELQRLRKCFLASYRTITNPGQLLLKLAERFQVPPSISSSSRAAIQNEVVEVLAMWLLDPIDFDPSMMMWIEEFAGVVVEKENAALAERLRSAAKDSEKKTWPAAAYFFAKPVKLASSYSLTPADLCMSSSPKDIAQQLTLIDFDVFRRIEPRELLLQAWSKKTTKHRAPNVRALIRRFNRVSYWLATIVLCHEKLKDRAAALEKFINIAKELHALQNYNTLMGIIAGIRMSCVARLSFSQLTVNENLTKDFDKLCKMMEPQGSWKKYRAAIAGSSPPALPYFGLYLTDLTFIGDGNADFKGERINIRKRLQEGAVLEQVLKYQQKAYDIAPLHPLYEYLLDMPALDDDILYRMSLKREPRGASIADVL